MLAGPSVTRDEADKARVRLADGLARTRTREEELGRDGFHRLPLRIQNELAALQGQAAPLEDTLEAMLAAEQILKTYNKKLDDALNLVHQLSGEEGRRAPRERRRRRLLLLVGTLTTLALAAGLFAYRRALGTKAARCRAAVGCRDDGLCGAGLVFEGGPSFECRVESEADCKLSGACTRMGRCIQAGGACVASRDEDCRATERCKLEGLCGAREGDCVALRAEDCRPTPDCRAKGHCTPMDGRCKAGGDADCRASLLCEKESACHEVDGACLRFPDEFRR
jgi:hypothetical protein